jgi:hypothetical protein
MKAYGECSFILLGTPVMAETCKGNLYIIMLNFLHLKDLTFICVLRSTMPQDITYEDKIYILEANIMNMEVNNIYIYNINT